MAKTSGLAQQFYLGGYDLSGDVGAIQGAGSPRPTLDVTGINQSARHRVNGLSDGEISFNTWFNDAANQEHDALKGLPTADVHVMYAMGSSIGSVAAGLVAKQVNYDWQRGADGSLQGSVACKGAAGFPLEWCNLLTAGIRTDTGATNGTSRDDSAATTAGIRGYLQVFAFTGTDVTVVIQESSDNGVADPFTAKLTFTQITTGRQGERATAAGTVERYLRVATTTSAGFTSAAFTVAYQRGTAQDDEAL